MNTRTPVALFTYNRPEHTDRALDALSNSLQTEDCDFYFFSDGPKNPTNKPAVDATRTVLHKWAATFNATLMERSENLGLARSIHAGVTDLCERYGRVIVIEDDLVVDPTFLKYMIESLDRYQEDDSVMQVGGLTLCPPENIDTDAFLLPVTTTWGWATWKSAWQHFRWRPEDLDDAKRDSEWNALFNLNGTCAFSSMLEDRLANRNDSWGILWWYAVSRLRGLVVYPAQSLVWNGGFDGSGVHCGGADFLQQGNGPPRATLAMRDGFSFPTDAAYDPAHLQLLENFFRSMQADDPAEKSDSSQMSSLKRLRRKLKMRVASVFG